MGIEVKSTIVPDEYKNVLVAFADIPSDAINEIEAYPIESLRLIEESSKKVKEGELEEGSVINLHLKVTISDEAMQRYNEEFEALKNKELYGLD